MAKNINWYKVWQKLEDWHSATSRKPPVCKSCGQKTLLYDPPWEWQQKEIEKLLHEQNVVLNWKEIWDKFDAWLKPYKCKCEECHKTLEAFPEWGGQQDKIELLVNSQIEK